MRPTRFLLFVLVTLASSTALADVVGPPTPVTCPAGSIAETNHCGTLCVVPTCADEACPTGESCVSRSLCAEQVSCGGWGYTPTVVYSECTGACAQGRCEVVRVCGRTDATPDAGTAGPEQARWGCGCRAAGGRAGGLGWLALLALAWMGRRRARRS